MAREIPRPTLKPRQDGRVNVAIRSGRSLAGGGCPPVALAVLLSGCMSGALYSTAETLAPGKFAAILVVPQAWHVQREASNPPGGHFGVRTDRDTKLSLIPPGLEARVGVFDGIDVGVGLLTADVKFRVLKSEWVSLAIDPRFRLLVASLPGGEWDGEVGELPLLASVTPWRPLTLVANTGPAYVRLASPDTNPATKTFAWRSGFGVRVRLTSAKSDVEFALQPEVAYFHGVAGSPLRWLSGGLGISIGMAQGSGP